MSESKKILIVDDEPNIVLAIETILDDSRFELFTASDGETGLQLATTIHPDLIILDVMMPGMDGYEVGKKIRNIESLDDIYILFLTAKGTKTDKEDGYASGAELYMVKPFDNDELLEKVLYLLGLDA
ncbi:MAG: response regulator [Saprospiraceae bacterium]